VGTSILVSYIRKAAGRPQHAGDIAVITYFNMLINCRLRHYGKFSQGYIVSTTDNVLAHARIPPSSDFTVFRQIWKDEEYKVAVEAIEKHLTPGPLNIIDAGANAGYSTLYLVSRLSGKYKPTVICIEPGNENVAILKRNIHINHFKDIVVEQAGLFNKACYLTVSTDFRDGKDWSLQVEESNGETDLKGVEVQELMDKYEWDHVDFFKIDIEGAERYLFADEAYASHFLRKVKMISIEIHDEYKIEHRILEILKANHFTYRKSGEITLGINSLLVDRK
jgi:FkbM family methyltransferase